MICIIHKILVLLKISRILKRFLRSILIYYFLKFIWQLIMIEILSPEEENILKDVRNYFKLEKIKKETQLTLQLKI